MAARRVDFSSHFHIIYITRWFFIIYCISYHISHFIMSNEKSSLIFHLTLGSSIRSHCQSKRISLPILRWCTWFWNSSSHSEAFPSITSTSYIKVCRQARQYPSRLQRTVAVGYLHSWPFESSPIPGRLQTYPTRKLPFGIPTHRTPTILSRYGRRIIVQPW